MNVQTEASGPPTNINVASADTLARNVTGIGPTLAQRIVAYREAHGPYSSVDELVQVSGIADVLLAKFRDQVTVGNAEAERQGIESGAEIAPAEGGSMTDETRNEEEQVEQGISEGGDGPVAESQQPDAVVPWAERLPAGDEDFSEEVEAEREVESEIEPELAPDSVPEPQAEFESEAESEIEEPEPDAEADLEPEFEEPEFETELEAEVESEFEESELEAEAGLEPEFEEPELVTEVGPEVEEPGLETEADLEPESEEPELEAELEAEFEEPELEAEADAGIEPEFEEPEMETELGAEVEHEEQGAGSSFVTYVEGPETVGTSAEAVASIDAEPIEEGMEQEEAEAMSADAMTMTGSESRAAEREEARPQPEPVVHYVEQRSNPWRNVLLVLLGGIAGVLLTLLVAVIWTGTVNFAPRAEVDALSRNLDTIYGNQELAWQRIDQLVTRANELESEVVQLRLVRDQVGAMQGELQAAQAEVTAAQSGLATLQQEIGQLEGDLRDSMGELDQRVQGAEGDIADMGATLQAIETHVDRVDVFFGALRALLLDMQGLPEATTETAPEG